MKILKPHIRSPKPTRNPKHERPAMRRSPTSSLRHLLFWLLTSVLCPLASAQYSIDWWTVDGGGAQARAGSIPSAAPSASRMRAR